jgi:hypothetical protein
MALYPSALLQPGGPTALYSMSKAPIPDCTLQRGLQCLQCLQCLHAWSMWLGP